MTPRTISRPVAIAAAPSEKAPARSAGGTGILPSPRIVMLAGLGLGELYRDGWETGGVYFDGTDLTFGLLGLSLLVYRLPRGALRNLPYLRWWVLLGVLLSLSYVLQPGAWPYITSPAALGYQLYRYCWRPILYFPLALVLFRNGSKIDLAILAVIAWADWFALNAVWQMYTGAPHINGGFLTKNLMGGALIAPFILSGVGCLIASGRKRMFLYACVLLILRALISGGSRGAFIAAVCGGAIAAVLIATRPEGRARFSSLIPALVLVVLAIGALKPDVLERPAISYMIRGLTPTDVDTFQWRVQERWPYFLDVVRGNPVFGIGTEVDVGFGERGNTPHNGYLGLAVANGIPATLLYVGLLLAGVRSGVTVALHGASPKERIRAAGLAGALAGILVHNVGESTFKSSFIGPTCWLLAALCILLDLEARRATRAAKAEPPTGRAAPTPIARRRPQAVK